VLDSLLLVALRMRLEHLGGEDAHLAVQLLQRLALLLRANVCSEQLRVSRGVPIIIAKETISKNVTGKISGVPRKIQYQWGVCTEK
jgi:hypothetical protein